MLWGSWRKNREGRAGKRVPGKSPQARSPISGFREGLLHTKELPARPLSVPFSIPARLPSQTISESIAI